MKNGFGWSKVLGVSALVLVGVAGCGSGGEDAGSTAGGNSNNGVSNAIKSPVVGKDGDKAMAGGDASGGTSTAGNTATGATGNTATGGANTKMGGSTTPGGKMGGSTTVNGGKPAGAAGSKMSGGAAGSKMGSGAAGGNNSNGGVPNSIKSPVMGKKDDKAMAGGTSTP